MRSTLRSLPQLRLDVVLFASISALVALLAARLFLALEAHWVTLALSAVALGLLYEFLVTLGARVFVYRWLRTSSFARERNWTLRNVPAVMQKLVHVAHFASGFALLTAMSVLLAANALLQPLQLAALGAVGLVLAYGTVRRAIAVSRLVNSSMLLWMLLLEDYGIEAVHKVVTDKIAEDVARASLAQADVAPRTQAQDC